MHLNISSNFCVIILETGHCPDFNVDEEFDDEITLCNVPEKPKEMEYNFAQLHIHIGRDENKRSEHCIDNKFNPMAVSI